MYKEILHCLNGFKNDEIMNFLLIFIGKIYENYDKISHRELSFRKKRHNHVWIIYNLT